MNYYKAVEKKPEHGGGWAFMQLNRREGAAIYCQCSWEDPGHATAEEAERCFYEKQMDGIRWSKQAQADRCKVCGEWTDELLHPTGHLFDPMEPVCRSHFEPIDENYDARALAWLREQNPFVPGIQITASW